MFRSLALSLTVLSACAADARGDLFFGTGTIQTGPVTTQADVNLINGNSSLGAQYINSIASNVFGTPTTFNALGSNLLSTYGLSSGGGPSATFGGQQVVAVFAAQGFAPNPASFTLNQATVALYTVAPNTYNQFIPSTWGTAGAPIATFTLRPGERSIDVFPGSGVFNALNPNQWNQASVNVTVGQANQGFFLFNEALNPNFWNQTAPLPPGTSTGEGIGIRADESLVQGNTTNTQGFDTAAEIAFANGIFNALLPGVSPFGFATGFGGLGNSGGTPTDFNPSNSATGAPNTADLVETLGTTTGHFAAAETPPGTRVPEPATLMVFAGMMGIGGLVYRRRTAKVAA